MYFGSFSLSKEDQTGQTPHTERFCHTALPLYLTYLLYGPNESEECYN